MRRVAKPLANTYETNLFVDKPKSDPEPNWLPWVEIKHVGNVRIFEEIGTNGAATLTSVRMGDTFFGPDEQRGTSCGRENAIPNLTEQAIELLNDVYDAGIAVGAERERSRIMNLSRELSAEDPLVKLRTLIVADDED
jgi:hypothetical protein